MTRHPKNFSDWPDRVPLHQPAPHPAHGVQAQSQALDPGGQDQ